MEQYIISIKENMMCQDSNGNLIIEKKKLNSIRKYILK
jgi:hypothetical protein